LKVLGFGRLLIVNGHGGNVEALAVIARELAHEFSMPIVCTTPWYLAEPEQRAVFESDFYSGRHACEGETSIMMAITPDLVRHDAFDEATRQRPAPVEPRPGFYRFYSFAELAPVRGNTGDPSKATAEKGERFLNIQARELASALLDEALWTPPDPVWSPGRGLGSIAGRQD
jgi:creatinine amidohydrolase